MDQHLNQRQSYIILFNAVKTRPDWTTLSDLLFPIQGQNRSSVFPKYTVDHSHNIFGKFWSPVLALLWTQEAMSKLALRALNDLKSPRRELKQKCPAFSFTSTFTNEGLRHILKYILKSTEHPKFVTLCFCLTHHLQQTAQNGTTSQEFMQEHPWTQLSLSSEGYQPDLASLDPNTQKTGFCSKHSLVMFSLHLNWHTTLKGEQGSTK